MIIVKFAGLAPKSLTRSVFQALKSHQALKRRIARLIGDESVSQVFADGAHVELSPPLGPL